MTSNVATALDTRWLGTTGLKITTVGFGAWAVGGGDWSHGWGHQDDEPIRREVEASLRRLGVERIDLYQFHWPDETGTPIEESWGEMARLIDEGKVRAAGVSNFDVALLERAEAVRHVDSLQPPFSLIHRDSGAEVIPWAAAHDTGVIVYSPMQSGILTDAFNPGRVAAMAANDWRRRSADFAEPNLSRNLALRDALRPVAARTGPPCHRWRWHGRWRGRG